jgi:putative transposase
MGLRFSEQTNFSGFFITTTFHQWKALGESGGLYQSIADSLNFCIGKYKVRISGYVFMPSHIHLLIFIDGRNLSNFMRDFKKYIAQKIVPALRIKTEKVWMDGFDRVAIETESIFRTKLDYIHYNPVRAGLASSPEDWKWSSAIDYFTNRSGLIPIFRDWH